MWKTVWKFCKQLKIEPPCDPTIPLMGMDLKKIKALTQKDTCTPVSKVWKQQQPKCGAIGAHQQMNG